MNLIPTLLPILSEGAITPGGFYFNAVGSTYGAQSDWVVALINWVSILCTVGIVLTMIYFVIRYRQKDRNAVPHGPTHNTALELVWSIGPSIFLAIIFIIGFRDFMHMTETPSDTKLTVKVIAHKWAWQFQYDNGYINDTEVVVPGNTKVKYVITSQDVIHSFSVTEFRMKKDAVPGRQNDMWAEAIYDPTDRMHTFTRTLIDPSERDADGKPKKIDFKVNIYHIYCQEYCGDNHSRMLGRVVVVDPAKFDLFMKLTNNIRRDAPKDVGKKIYEANCMSCHSVDGSPLIGPSWQGLWGKEESIAGVGKVKVDYDYVRESIHDPAAKIVAGFEGKNMPPFALSDDQIDAVIEYMKTLKPAVEDKARAWSDIDTDRDARKKGK